jgi:hypothetical protein
MSSPSGDVADHVPLGPSGVEVARAHLSEAASVVAEAGTRGKPPSGSGSARMAAGSLNWAWAV